MLPFGLELPLLRRVWRLALPVIFTNLLVASVNMADVFMVGRLGPIEIAAVGIANTVRMLVVIAILSVSAGATTLASQAKGARDPKRLSFVVRQSLSLLTLVGLLFSLFGWLGAEPILRFLNSNGDPQAVVLGTGYLKLLFLGTVFLAGNFAVSNLMQGAGDTVTPLRISIGVNVLNIGFNYLLIFGPGPLPALGVEGAALGTIAARALGMAAGIALFYSGGNVITLLPGSYLPHWGMFRDMLIIGIPSGLEGLVRTTGSLLVVRIVTSTPAGSYGAAALAIGLQIGSLAVMPGLAVSIAATSLVGRSLGAWQVTEARKRGSTSIWLGVAVMTLLGVPLVLFAPQLVRLFEPSGQATVLAAGTSYLRIVSLSLPLLAVGVVTNGALRGAGDTIPGLIGNLLGRWGTAVSVAYVLALPLGLGAAGVWWGIVAGTAVTSFYVLLRWRSGDWVWVALTKTDVYRRHLKDQPQAVRERFLADIRAPLMSYPETTEQVHPKGVRYRLAAGEVQIRFETEGYQVEAGRELLAAMSTATPATAPRSGSRHR